jgi:predicted MFS family arabinose efflux permease
MPEITAETRRQRFTLAPQGSAARLVLAVLTSAGIFYANLSPVIVSGLIGFLDFSNDDAGFVMAANTYGAAIGTLLAIGLVKRVPWRPTAALLLVTLIMLDLMTIGATSPAALIGVRFLHGLTGGATMGIGFSVIARTQHPERTFGFAILVQLGLGGAAIAGLTPLLPTLGPAVVWSALAMFSGLALLTLPLLDTYPLSATAGPRGKAAGRAPLLVVLTTMAAIFLFQSGQMSMFTYIIELGKHYGLELGFVSLTVAGSFWTGIPGALLVVWWSTRSGRLRPIAFGIGFTMLAITMLLGGDRVSFVAANVCFGLAFAITVPYLLGLASELDASGQMSALGGFLSTLGLASGPVLGALLTRENGFDTLIYAALILLILSVCAAAYPARYLDGRDQAHRTSRLR